MDAYRPRFPVVGCRPTLRAHLRRLAVWLNDGPYLLLVIVVTLALIRFL